MRKLPFIVLLLFMLPVQGQSGPSFRLEGTFNTGGHPGAGALPQSANYRITLDSIGETLVAPGLRSASYAMDLNRAHSYPPPGEVHGLVVLGDKQTLAWGPERSVDTYRVYRGDLFELPVDYGDCRVTEVPFESVTLDETPDYFELYFYLVTAQGSLLEEGTLGSDSSGARRQVAVPCP